MKHRTTREAAISEHSWRQFSLKLYHFTMLVGAIILAGVFVFVLFWLFGKEPHEVIKSML